MQGIFSASMPPRVEALILPAQAAGKIRELTQQRGIYQ
jgi:hypothetical protein